MRKQSGWRVGNIVVKAEEGSIELHQGEDLVAIRADQMLDIFNALMNADIVARGDLYTAREPSSWLPSEREIMRDLKAKERESCQAMLEHAEEAELDYDRALALKPEGFSQGFSQGFSS